MNNYDEEYLEEVANTIIKSEGYMNDKELMKAVEPVIERITEAAERLKGFDFKSMRELAGKKALEESVSYEQPNAELGEDLSAYSTPQGKK
jgi:hypothetical protein